MSRRLPKPDERIVFAPDPIPGSPEGTPGWASFVCANIAASLKEAKQQPQEVARCLEMLQAHEPWTLLWRRDGSKFPAGFGGFLEFVEYQRPWGWGMQWAELRPILEFAVGRERLELALGVHLAKERPGPAEGTRNNPNGRAGKPEEETAEDGKQGQRAAEDGTGTNSELSSELVPEPEVHSDAAKRESEFVRAIARAPEPVKALYAEGLVEKKAAAKLGPYKPDPAQAEAVQRATEVAVETAKRLEGEPKPRVKREVSRAVRDALGIEQDPVAPLLTKARKLSREDLERLCDEIMRLVAAVDTGDACSLTG